MEAYRLEKMYTKQLIRRDSHQADDRMGTFKHSNYWRRSSVVTKASCLGLTVVLLASVALWRTEKPTLHAKHIVTSLNERQPKRLSDLLAARRQDLPSMDIARMNLLCAEDLPGAGDLNLGQCLQTVEAMANRVRSETERHYYRFKQNPAEFENSEGFFRMLLLTVVLEEDFKVRYDPARKAVPMTANEGDGFFADAGGVFLHGLLGSKRQGTCSSMPVLYVAVGRRLGYPLKLVTTKGHLFVRWEGNGERFNVEATSHGLNRFDDDYYRHWPFEITTAEEIGEGYLKSLTQREELGVFLSIRAMCLREARRTKEAVDCFGVAAKCFPGCRSFSRLAEETLDRVLPLMVLPGVRNDS